MRIDTAVILAGQKKEIAMDRSKAKRDYKQAKQPMGVYRIMNTQNGKSYVGFSTDLPARINRQKAELKARAV